MREKIYSIVKEVLTSKGLVRGEEILIPNQPENAIAFTVDDLVEKIMKAIRPPELLKSPTFTNAEANLYILALQNEIRRSYETISTLFNELHKHKDLELTILAFAEWIERKGYYSIESTSGTAKYVYEQYMQSI